MRLDLRTLSFDEFVDFVFEHPVADEEAGEKEWYWDEEWDDLLLDPPIDPRQQLEYLTRLLRHSEVLGKKFSADQLEQGFWFLINGMGLRIGLGLVWEESLEWGLRAECIAALAHLYERLFLPLVLDTSPFMLWDSLIADRLGYPRPERPLSPDEERVRTAIFQTLQQILQLDAQVCQAAALHGLYHLDCPGTSAVIGGFLTGHQSLDPEIREYAVQVLEQMAI